MKLGALYTPKSGTRHSESTGHNGVHADLVDLAAIHSLVTIFRGSKVVEGTSESPVDYLSQSGMVREAGCFGSLHVELSAALRREPSASMMLGQSVPH